MTVMTSSALPVPPQLTIRLWGSSYPVILPSWRDARLHLAAVIISLQVLGQAAFHFRLSIAQILISLATCAVLELTRQRRRSLRPAAAGDDETRGRRTVRRNRLNKAERAGFEPATHLSARTRFPVALLRPLGHLSVA
jgi:hypothetical protein